MTALIPHTSWQPLSLTETLDLFAGAPFAWALGGGYAVEQFLGRQIRAHEDVDVVIFRDQQLQAQTWLQGWQLYAADPPGTLREWLDGEVLPFGIHDIWAHRSNVEAWQFQFMVAESEGDEWFSRRSSAIRGKRDDLFAEYNGVPCVRIEVQLMYKAKGRRPKDVLDFHAAAPRLSAEAKQWLKDALGLLYPDGHPWLDMLNVIENKG
ncbi:MAG: amino acid transporter [Chloroflexota bacterium]